MKPDVLVDVLRGWEPGIQLLEKYEQDNVPGLSSVSYVELIAGCRDKQELKHITDFINRF